MKTGIFLIIDENNSKCGITDRLKTAVGLCYVARVNGVGFRIIHSAGFDLRDYLLPNRIDWSADLSDISENPDEKQMIRYIAPYTDLPEFRDDIQYICREYIGNNLIEKWNVPEWQKVWRELFWDMFTPSENVRKALDECEMPKHYTAVVARFINSLGHTEDVEYNFPLSSDMKKRLIDEVLRKVVECEKEADSEIVVYSDSAVFLRAAAENGYTITDVNGIGNIMNNGIGEYVTLRTFVNMFQMSEADKIYSILNVDGFPENSLYNTQYPRYAAIIGDKPFVKI